MCGPCVHMYVVSSQPCETSFLEPKLGLTPNGSFYGPAPTLDEHICRKMFQARYLESHWVCSNEDLYHFFSNMTLRIAHIVLISSKKFYLGVIHKPR